MKGTAKEYEVYKFFKDQGISNDALIHFIQHARNCPMYASIFHIKNLDPKLKRLLSGIYHNRINFVIGGIDARWFIAETWSL